jgi:hypothetical protein
MPTITDITPVPQQFTTDNDYINGWSGGVDSKNVPLLFKTRPYPNQLLLDNNNYTLTKTYNDLNIGDTLSLTIFPYDSKAGTSSVRVDFTQGNITTSLGDINNTKTLLYPPYGTPPQDKILSPKLNPIFNESIVLTANSVTITITFTNLGYYPRYIYLNDANKPSYKITNQSNTNLVGYAPNMDSSTTWDLANHSFLESLNNSPYLNSEDSANKNKFVAPKITVTTSSPTPVVITPGLLTAYGNSPNRIALSGKLKASDSISGAPYNHYGISTTTIGCITGFFKDEDGDVVALCPYSVCFPFPQASAIGALVYRPAIHDNINDYTYRGWPDDPIALANLPYFGTIKRSPMLTPYKTEKVTLSPQSGKTVNTEQYGYVTSGPDYCLVKVHPYFLKYNLIESRYLGPSNIARNIPTDTSGAISPYEFELGDIGFTQNGSAIFSASYQLGITFKHAYDRIDQFKSDGVNFSPNGAYGYPQASLDSPIFNSQSSHDTKNLLQANFNAIPVTLYGPTPIDLFAIWVPFNNGLVYQGYPWNPDYKAGLYDKTVERHTDIFLNYAVKRAFDQDKSSDVRILLNVPAYVPSPQHGVLVQTLPDYKAANMYSGSTPVSHDRNIGTPILRSYGAIILDNRGCVVPMGGAYEAIMYYKLKPLKL